MPTEAEYREYYEQNPPGSLPEMAENAVNSGRDWVLSNSWAGLLKVGGSSFGINAGIAAGLIFGGTLTGVMALDLTGIAPMMQNAAPGSSAMVHVGPFEGGWHALNMATQMTTSSLGLLTIGTAGVAGAYQGLTAHRDDITAQKEQALERRESPAPEPQITPEPAPAKAPEAASPPPPPASPKEAQPAPEVEPSAPPRRETRAVMPGGFEEKELLRRAVAQRMREKQGESACL